MTAFDPPEVVRTSVIAACPALSGLPWQAERGGRVNRLWRVGTVMAKIYSDDGASLLFPNNARDEALALRHLGPRGLAPTLVAAGAGWVVYPRVPGRSWSHDAARAALALHALHASDPGLPFRRAPCGSAEIAAHGARIAATLGPSAPPRPQDPGVPPPVRLRLIHGDAVAGNLIVGREGLRWIDWQCPALGDPAEDLAAFLSPAMQHLYRGQPLTVEETARFLDAYPDRATVDRYRALAAVLHWRLALHCLWRAARGAPGYAEAAALELDQVPAG